MSKEKLPRYGCETEETHYLPICARCKTWEKLLDKEYAEHTRDVQQLRAVDDLRLFEIDDLKQRIAELTAQLEDEQLSKLTTIRTMADDCLRGRTGKSDVEILHEIVSLIDDEDEKPCP
jgi:uncharacterized small protein (DUF1192 family)